MKYLNIVFKKINDFFIKGIPDIISPGFIFIKILLIFCIIGTIYFIDQDYIAYKNNGYSIYSKTDTNVSDTTKLKSIIIIQNKKIDSLIKEINQQ